MIVALKLFLPWIAQDVYKRIWVTVMMPLMTMITTILSSDDCNQIQYNTLLTTEKDKCDKVLFVHLLLNEVCPPCCKKDIWDQFRIEIFLVFLKSAGFLV